MCRQVLEVTQKCRDSSSLSIRRASLAASLATAEAWLEQRARAPDFRSELGAAPAGPLAALTTVSTAGGLFNNPHSRRPAPIDEFDAAMAELCDWAMATIQEDADMHCRVLKGEILRLAVAGFEE